MLISPAYSTISEAACASQRLHTISCGPAMCLLGSLFPAISRLHVQPVALAAIFAKDLPHVLPLLLPARHVYPFVATCVPKLPLDLPPVLYFSTWICQRSVATNVAVTFAPVIFCHPCCPKHCHRHCHCHYSCPHGLPWLLPSYLGAS